MEIKISFEEDSTLKCCLLLDKTLTLQQNDDIIKT